MPNFSIISTPIEASYKFSKTYLLLNLKKRPNDFNNSLCHKNE